MASAYKGIRLGIGLGRGVRQAAAVMSAIELPIYWMLLDSMRPASERYSRDALLPANSCRPACAATSARHGEFGTSTPK